MNFFSDVPGIFHFRLFGFWHIVLTITMLLAMVLIYKYQEALRKWKYHDKAFRYIVAGIMFTNMAIYYGQKILDGTWSYKAVSYTHLDVYKRQQLACLILR